MGGGAEAGQGSEVSFPRKQPSFARRTAGGGCPHINPPMKKKNSKPGGSAMRGKAAAKSVDEYLAGVPEPGRSTLKQIRTVIRSVVPPETIETISYGIPTFKYKRGLVAYAAFTNHCSFFPLGSSALDSVQEELKEFRVSKGTLHFPLDKPLPDALVKKIVKARIAQNEGRK